jgi:hypothetical protein
MRLQRTQHNARLPFGLISRLSLLTLTAAWLGNGATASAQPFTYAEPVAYYGTDSAQAQSPASAGYAPSFQYPLGLDYLPADLGPGSFVYSFGGFSDIPGTVNESVNFVRLTDDINEDGIPGGIIIVDPVTGLSNTMTDFDDLHTFNIAFNQIGIARQSGLRGFDEGGVVWLRENGGVRPSPDRVRAQRTEAAIANLPIDTPEVRRGTGSRTVFVRVPRRSYLVPQYSKFAANRRGSGVGLTYGFYEGALYDRFRFDGEGGILGRTYSDTRADNVIDGSQVGVVGYYTIGPLTFYAHNLLVIGINDGELRQDNGIGAELVPGATNRLLYAQPTYSYHQATFAQVVPTVVSWAEANLQITKHTSFKVALSSIFMNNILMAQDRVRYYLPDMGFRDPGNQNFTQQTLYCGVEIVR